MHGISPRQDGNTVVGKLWLEKEQSTTVWHTGSLRNTIWHDNLGRAKNLLAGRTKLSCFPQNNHTQNFGSALRASPLCHKFRLGPLGFAICLSGHLSTKTQPNCQLGPAGLTFRASQMPRSPLFCPSMSVSHCFFSEHAVALDLTDLFVVNVLAHTYAPLYDLFALWKARWSGARNEFVICWSWKDERSINKSCLVIQLGCRCLQSLCIFITCYDVLLAIQPAASNRGRRCTNTCVYDRVLCRITEILCATSQGLCRLSRCVIVMTVSSVCFWFFSFQLTVHCW